MLHAQAISAKSVSLAYSHLSTCKAECPRNAVLLHLAAPASINDAVNHVLGIAIPYLAKPARSWQKGLWDERPQLAHLVNRMAFCFVAIGIMLRQ